MRVKVQKYEGLWQNETENAQGDNMADKQRNYIHGVREFWLISID